MIYKDYLKSDQWKNKKHLLLLRKGAKCEKCGCREGLEIHHGSYDNKFKETKKDLFVLCQGCHWEFHHIYGTKKSMKWQTQKFIKSKKKMF